VKSRARITDNYPENPWTISLARFSFPPAPSLLGSESSANRLLIAGKLARKIRWDIPVSEIAREFIFSRRALRGEVAKCYYGQLFGKTLGTFPDLATTWRPCWQSARVLADLYSPQNLFLIARKNTRKIRLDNRCPDYHPSSSGAS